MHLTYFFIFEILIEYLFLSLKKKVYFFKTGAVWLYQVKQLMFKKWNKTPKTSVQPLCPCL